MDKLLGTCVIEQLNQGNKLDGRNAWKQTTWTVAVSALSRHCGRVVTQQNILSRLKIWENHYDMLSPLLGKSGELFTWDYARNHIQAHDESIWKDHLKANPKLTPYRKRIEIENWDDICVIFAQDRANGEGAKTASEESANPDVEIEIVGETSNPEVGPTMANEQRFKHAAIGQEGKSFQSTSSSSRGAKRKLSETQVLCNSVSQMADSLTNFFNSHRATPNEVLEELKKVPDLDLDQIVKGIDFLRRDHVNFETFCGWL